MLSVPSIEGPRVLKSAHHCPRVRLTEGQPFLVGAWSACHAVDNTARALQGAWTSDTWRALCVACVWRT